ncbi:hypothetical protein [Neptunomonas marina]|uniref:Uncharacterized protein n=1 Tax=Neptunomonas marina TaxID=1815562 RepID=A0A437QDF2_9GAMM|nr:hypothetical protein [Neptunomonas marina]RVU32554.1 hypothetical protein EOE65_02570 [Neptunomonas marina]
MSAYNKIRLPQWAEPNTTIGSGHDIRTSENGLLNSFYGSLEHASRFAWLNAGRTLIDKTYINLLWQAVGLHLGGRTSDELARELDSFIRTHIAPRWDDLEEWNPEQQQQRVGELVDILAGVLGGQDPQREASWLLFYMLPQLPVFPLWASDIGTYAEHHTACRAHFSHHLPTFYTPAPKAAVGTPDERCVIDQAVKMGDWWQRRCFIAQAMPVTLDSQIR